jgi:hypothetical protein
MNFDDNIILNMNENLEDPGSLFDLSKLQDELTQSDTEFDLDTGFGPPSINDTIKEIIEFTVKQLMFICEYYGISKGVKMCKFKKQEIMETIIMFESDPENRVIVLKRRKIWHFMNELKKDKVIKKCIIWPITN